MFDRIGRLVQTLAAVPGFQILDVEHVNREACYVTNVLNEAGLSSPISRYCGCDRLLSMGTKRRHFRGPRAKRRNSTTGSHGQHWYLASALLLGRSDAR